IVVKNQPTSPNKPGLFRNWLTAAGVVIAGGGLFAFVLLFGIDTFAHHRNPYMGLLAYVVAPGFMVLGALLGVLGAWLHRRQLLKGTFGTEQPAITIDLTRARDRKVLVGVLVSAAFFLLLT